MYVHGEGHWRGNRPERYCGRLTVEVKSSDDAWALAALFRLLAGGDAGRLRRLADLAERVEREDAAGADPALCG
jgi:hypothetical protein